MLRTPWLAALTCLTGVAVPHLARAYDLARDTTGSTVRWASTDVAFLIDPTSRDLASADVLAAVQRATSHWNGAVGLNLTVTAETGHGTPGYDAAHPGQNHNEILFVDDDWDLDEGVIATTLVTMDSTTHQILDTDILINGSQHRFAILPDGSVSGCGIDDDLESALTHELGHAIGMAHNPGLTTATMYPSAQPGEVTERVLSSDDIAGANALYVVTAPSSGTPTPAGGCSSAGGSGVGSLVLVALLSFRRSTRRARSVAALGVGLGLSSVAQAEKPVVELQVTGRVQSARAEWRRGVIVTHVAVEVTECRKGDCPGQVEFEMLGGRVGDVEQRLSDQAPPMTGDQLEVSLNHGRSGALRATGTVRLIHSATPSVP